MKKLLMLAFALRSVGLRDRSSRAPIPPRPHPGRRSIRSACPTGPAQLASDDLQGRAPGTEGETRTIAWLTEQFRALGLEPGGENGGWTQRVPLIRTQVPAAGALHHRQPRPDPDAAIAARPLCQHRARDRPGRGSPNAPMVFVGYGVTAPERGWDDFGDVDLQRQDRGLPGQRSRFRGGAPASRSPAGSAAGR